MPSYTTNTSEEVVTYLITSYLSDSRDYPVRCLFYLAHRLPHLVYLRDGGAYPLGCLFQLAVIGRELIINVAL